MATLRELLFLLLIAVVYGGLTKPADISQFWMDDIKALDAIYGKTSDKQLYGATLPPAITFDFDLNKIIKAQESQKKERFSLLDDDLGSDEQFYPSAVERYAKLFGKSLEKKPQHFMSLSSLKPISESNDPEMYNYLKHLEDFEKYKGLYKNKFKHAANTEEEDAYRSIQDILDAHEANKGHKTESEFNDSFEKYPRHEKDEEDLPRYAAKAKPMKSKVRFINNNTIRARCRSGRCRKRPSSYRSGARPYIRKIKRYRID